MRKNKDGTRNKQDLNIQDHDSLNLSPAGKALWMFEQWAYMRPTWGYYDLLPPSARMAVDAVQEVLQTLQSKEAFQPTLAGQDERHKGR
jgi:hypothetical protein